RRGYPAVAVREFCEKIGVSKANSEVEMAYLESCVRDNLNKTANRAMVVMEPLKVVLTNFNEVEQVEVENNPNDAVVTNRKVTISKEIYIEQSDFALVPPPKYYRLKPDGVVRLKGAYIIHCDKVIQDNDGKVIELHCSVVENSKSGNDTSGVKVKGVIQWVDAQSAIGITVRKIESLLVDATDNATDFMDRLNPHSMTEARALAESGISSAKVGDRFQFMRVGYYILDKDSRENNLVFNEIVGLKDNFNK
ncbi:MAG: glutamine--tRNA ligase, partial [Clostridia bacterium]